MADVRFYHLQRQTLDDALPRLLETILGRGMKVLLQVTSAERLAFLDGHLWTFRADSFLPHGPDDAPHATEQPVLLTVADGPAVNGAEVLVLADGAWRDAVDGFAIVCNLFDGNDDEAVRTARVRWRATKDAGHVLTYWQQGARGGWEKKA